MFDTLELINEMNGSVWIRAEGKTKLESSGMTIFRLEFELSSCPVEAKIMVSALDRYRLYVNGSSILCGPRKGGFDRYYETIDIKNKLKKGFNTLTARVVSYPDQALNGKEWGPMSVQVNGLGAAFVLSGCAILGNGQKVQMSTGKADWTACPDKSYSLDNSCGWCVIHTEEFNAEKSLDWRENKPLGLKKAVNLFATGIEAHGELSRIALRPRMIPNMYETRASFERVMEHNSTFEFKNSKACIPAGKTGCIELDAGELTTAYFRLKSKGRGGKIKVTYAERYFPKDDSTPFGEMRRDDELDGRLIGQCDVIYPCEKERVFESFWFRTFRFVRIDVEAGKSDVDIELMDFIRTGYPLEVKASPRFDDPRKEKLWDMSIRTLKNCMHETYEDCPYYEQMQYPQDTRLQALFTYSVSGDTRLAANAIWDIHCGALPNGLLQSRYPSHSVQVVPGFSLYWIMMLDEYVDFSKDISCIRDYLPTVDGVLNYFDKHINSDGLVEGLGYWEFADWTPEWELGVPQAVKWGTSSLHNLNYALTLKAAARLALLAGRKGMCEEYTARANEIIKAVIRLCYDEEKGLVSEGPGSKQFSQHTQALSVLTEAIIDEKAKRAIRLAMSRDDMVKCSFPWHHTLFRAFEKAGLYDELAPKLWEEYYPILDRNLTTMPEGLSHNRSDCHAWSASPLYEFLRHK